MRLRNIPAARPAIENSRFCIGNPETYKGQWNRFFQNDNPLRIEIGMGKGQFILTQAQMHQDINYLGLERYESVMYRAVQRLEAEEGTEEYQNLRLICCDAVDLAEFFEKDEIEGIYLNFSDPWPKARHAKRRLTSRRFLNIYEKVLKEGGFVEFKTDNVDLFAFSKEELKEADNWTIEELTEDLHAAGQEAKPLLIDNVQTEYEDKFVAEGKPIHKLIARYGRNS